MPPVMLKSVGAFGSLKKPAWNCFVLLLNRQIDTTAEAGETSAAMLAIGVPAVVVAMIWLQPRSSAYGWVGVAPAIRMPAGPPMLGQEVRLRRA
jgi:hypothetical protein